jgi:3-oxoacyl-[acyl-carrier-protein] synthase-1
MATSLGGVVAGSAAQRAGLTRPVALDSFYKAEDKRLQRLVGHRVLATSADSPVDQWTEMALPAARELCSYGALPDHGDSKFWRRTAVMAALPVMDIERFFWPPEQIMDVVRDELLGSIVGTLEVPVEPALLFDLPNGQTATARAIVLARENLRSARFERALIVAVDSLVHPQSLDWLASNRRLKTRDDPAGLSPSEAAVCLLVESKAACAKRGGRAEAVVEAESVVEARRFTSVDVAMASGQALAQAIQSVLGLAGARGPFSGDIFLDLDGEVWSARAWGHAQSRLMGQVDFARARIMSPCGEVGFTGAASAALALCLGTRSFVRGYARGRQSLICSLSTYGDASAVLLGHHPHGSRPARVT